MKIPRRKDNKLLRMAYKHNGDFRAELRDTSGDVKVLPAITSY